jgi:hypothetical protein
MCTRRPTFTRFLETSTPKRKSARAPGRDFAQADVVPMPGDQGGPVKDAGRLAIQGQGQRPAGRGVDQDELGADGDPLAQAVEPGPAVVAMAYTGLVG